MKSFLATLAFAFVLTSWASAEDPWLVLPPTPTLPTPTKSGYAPVNGIQLWYADFGKGTPVVFLHGGLGNSDYWGLQVKALQSQYRIITVDTRGHGRSTRDERPYGYQLLADDVVALLDYLKIPKAAIVGWSDGAIVGIDLSLRYPARITKVFAFAANSDPSGVADISASPVFNAYIERAGKEYEKLSKTPTQYQSFLDQIGKMWETQPNYTKEQLATITTPIWVVDADHDEAIKRENTEFIAASIPHAGLLLLPRVSHFAFLQDPEGFTQEVRHFLTFLPDAQ